MTFITLRCTKASRNLQSCCSRSVRFHLHCYHSRLDQVSTQVGDAYSCCWRWTCMAVCRSRFNLRYHPQNSRAILNSCCCHYDAFHLHQPALFSSRLVCVAASHRQKAHQAAVATARVQTRCALWNATATANFPGIGPSTHRLRLHLCHQLPVARPQPALQARVRFQDQDTSNSDSCVRAPADGAPRRTSYGSTAAELLRARHPAAAAVAQNR